MIEELNNLLITVGIPTYEASESLVAALTSVYMQSVWSRIGEVVVVVDGSKKIRPEILSAIQNPKLKIAYYSKREGQSARLNDIIALATGQLVVLTNDDVILKNDAVEKIAESYIQTDAKLLAGLVRPFKAKSFLEKILEMQNEITYRIISMFKNSDTYLAANGRLMALDVNFAKSLDIPSALKNNDAHIYVSAKVKGVKFGFVKEALASYRNPSKISEYFKQSIKFQRSLEDNSRFFETDISKFYQVPTMILFEAFILTFLKFPIRTAIYTLLKSCSRVLSLVRKKEVVNNSGIWETDKSTKVVSK